MSVGPLSFRGYPLADSTTSPVVVTPAPTQGTTAFCRSNPGFTGDTVELSSQDQPKQGMSGGTVALIAAGAAALGVGIYHLCTRGKGGAEPDKAIAGAAGGAVTKVLTGRENSVQELGNVRQALKDAGIEIPKKIKKIADPEARLSAMQDLLNGTPAKKAKAAKPSAADKARAKELAANSAFAQQTPFTISRDQKRITTALPGMDEVTLSVTGKGKDRKIGRIAIAFPNITRGTDEAIIAGTNKTRFGTPNQRKFITDPKQIAEFVQTHLSDFGKKLQAYLKQQKLIPEAEAKA